MRSKLERMMWLIKLHLEAHMEVRGAHGGERSKLERMMWLIKSHMEVRGAHGGERSKLERMMWLIKSHMEEALWDMVTTSVSSFTRMVEAPCLGVPELPGDFAWGDDLVTSLFPPAPHQPLFALQLAIDEAGVGLSTDPDRFEVALVEVVNEAVRQTHQVPQVHPMVLANLRFARDLTLSSMGLLQPFMEEHRRRVASGLRRAVVPLKAYVAEYRQFLELWRKDVAEYLRQADARRGWGELAGRVAQELGGWSEPQRPAAELRDEALLQRQAAEDLEGRLPERLLLGPFALQVAPVKRALVGRRQDMAQGVLDIFAAGLRVQVDEVLEEFKAIMTKLCEKPASIEELLDLKDWMETIPANLETHGEVAKRLVMVYMMDHFMYSLDVGNFIAKWDTEYDMLDRFAYPVEAEDFAAKWDAAGFVRRIQMKVDDINQQLAEETERMKATHISDVAAMYDTIEDLAMRVHALAEEEDIAKVRELGQACSRLWEAMRESQESAALLVQRQRTFGLPPVAFEALPKLRREFEPYKSLWVTASEWLEWHSQWMDSPLETIEGENIDQVVTESARTMTRLYRTFSEAPGVQRVADEIRSKIDDFRPVVGLIQALRKPGMKPRHWKQIVDQTGIDVTLTPTLTFRQCLDMGLAEHTAAVEQVAEAAEKEFGLERGIAKITADWDAELMQLTPYKDTGTYIMKVADETVQMMDDNIIAVQQMLFSPYKDEFEAELNDLEERLRLAHVVLGEWFDCQKSWMYLQPIFSSDSIRKNLPMETNRFLTMERQWRRIMKSAVDNPKVLELCADRGLLRILQECNLGLEIVEKGLVAYLETKRDAFPRFYFLSDEELLEILSDATDPTAVQPHLRKCFENIAKLTFEEDLEITSMFSADGEQIGLRPSVRPIGDVESWLQKVEDSMRSTLRLTLADALADLAQEERGRWVLRWPGQLVIAGSQTSWTGSVEQAILGSALPRFLTRTLEQLDVLRSLVRGKLRWLERQVLSALIVIEVHARDVVISLIDKGVASVNDFEWISQLRYYWVEENLRIRMVNADFPYGYEYLGNTGRLVMTPLTDRCYLTLTGALHLQFGGAPAGPAGTGKTETTKDLAKAFAVQCVVFNCSDQLDYKAMGKFFTGLASAGAWACFDEFNRIDIEVLSVVAQQITTIQRAQMLRLRRFQFEEREIALKPSCAVFITMNPGYAGRTELPDNLKALFRPVAMMVPDYTLIAEISLFSFGFAAAKELAGKITSTFRLSSEQLSSQDHYDFGMRAVKTVIAAAGNLKREQPDMEERQVVLRALRDVNVPKFLADDLKLFDGIVSDLFPLMEELPVDYGILEAGVRQSCGEMRLEDVPEFVKKVIQLYETTVVRHGLMIVGPTGSGKTKVSASSAARHAQRWRSRGALKYLMIESE
ncbi:dynein axonemal heavy chain 1-like [Bacillus rossius redtenbacheri]|uniref:dynein axonemal heavy chain 1-like n=1 Tax=Bacillus rossius redtenbacheri TaxID=93214 RepID=UPI002FDDDA01